MFLSQRFSPLNTIWHSLPVSRHSITCRLLTFCSATRSDVSLKQQKATEQKQEGSSRERGEGRTARTRGCFAERYRRQSSTFFVICSLCGKKASYLLYYHQALIRTALTTHLSTKASWYLKAMHLCVCLRPHLEAPENTRGYLSLSFCYEIKVLVWFLLSLHKYNGAQ